MDKQNENLYTPGCIRTFTGKYFNPFLPDPELICIEDIAHALSMIPRFGGHLPVWYSVAEHCVHGAYNIVDEYRLWFLLHDATEAYMLDLPKPIKEQVPGYVNAENKLMMVIAVKFGLTWPMPAEVKYMDKMMLQWEWENLMIGSRFRDTTLSHTRAKDNFLNLFESLYKEKKEANNG